METLGKIGDRFATLLDMFDISFFVSGFSSIVAFVLFLVVVDRLPLPNPTVIQILAVIPVAYALGLVNFALGRWLRTRFRFRRKIAAFDSHFRTILTAHGLDTDPEIAAYLSRTEVVGIWRLHARLWAEIRNQSRDHVSVAFFARQWAMAAAFDGMVITTMLCTALAIAFLFLHVEPLWLSILLQVIVAGLGVFVAYIVGREASRNQEYITEDLVSTIATLRKAG